MASVTSSHPLGGPDLLGWTYSSPSLACGSRRTPYYATVGTIAVVVAFASVPPRSLAKGPPWKVRVDDAVAGSQRSLLTHDACITRVCNPPELQVTRGGGALGDCRRAERPTEEVPSSPSSRVPNWSDRPLDRTLIVLSSLAVCLLFLLVRTSPTDLSGTRCTVGRWWVHHQVIHNPAASRRAQQLALNIGVP
jgi:hypothetical protein